MFKLPDQLCLAKVCEYAVLLQSHLVHIRLNPEKRERPSVRKKLVPEKYGIRTTYNEKNAIIITNGCRVFNLPD